MNNIKLYAERKAENYKDTLNPDELKKLVYRVTKSEKYADLFEFKKIPQSKKGFDEYCMYNSNDKIVIEATSGVSASVAVNTYLKQYCQCYFGPITKNINLPGTPPRIEGKIQNSSVFLYRYFMNYCTFGYTLLFADWEEYEQLTDWMLLSGVNLMLNIVGYEIVWRDVLKNLNYTTDEINDFICGPQYLPWQWMGNMTKNGGNLSDNWYEKRKELGNKINNKMRSFGAEIMVPGYFGMVPTDFKNKFPQSEPIDQGTWCDTSQRPSVISSKDQMFDKVSELFYKELKNHFGDFYYFSGDPFHEGGITDGIDLAEYGAEIISEMKRFYPTGVWSLQGWGTNPKKEMLVKIPKEDMIICELAADKVYDLPKSYTGYPWIYSATHNFGGTRITDGNVRGFLTEPFEDVENKSSSLVGIGMTMEAIATDEIFFDIFSNNAIRDKKTSIEDFVESFVDCRYNTNNENVREAVNILAEKIFCLDKATRTFGGRESALCARPDINADRVSTCAESVEVSYDENNLITALKLLFSAYEQLQNNECYRFDLMDMARQTISNKSWHYLETIKNAYNSYDIDKFIEAKNKFLNLFDIQADLLATNKNTMLGPWLDKAEKYADNPIEAQKFVFDAKNMLTLWAEKDTSQILRDYAYKEWSGMIEFYKSRWNVYFNTLTIFFDRRGEMPEVDWKEFDYCFTVSNEKYPTEPQGDLKTAVEKALCEHKNNLNTGRKIQ